MNENEYLGERALFFKEPRSATAKAHGDCEVYYLEKEDFEMAIAKNLKDYLIDRIYLQDDTITLDQLTYLITLGSGSFGNVTLVKSMKKNYLYAMKNISNKQILYNQMHKSLELERSILLRIDHPFIVKLVKTLKDEKYIYFLMDFIRGKELFSVIRDIGMLTKSQTLFYGASIMLAVRYLHQRKFVYRDIKPENIMVLENGYIKIIDFGTAKLIEDKTKTTLGTPHYMAPEMIMGNGYSFEVDYWAIAVCMYEFICGEVPFGENSEDTMEIYLSIKNDKLVFPDFVHDYDFRNLMNHMLDKNLETRYSKFDQIAGHIYFKDFNWNELISFNMEPAYKPQMEKIENKYKPEPYLDYIKKLKDWEPPSDMKEPERIKRIEYNKWLEKF